MSSHCQSSEVGVLPEAPRGCQGGALCQGGAPESRGGLGGEQTLDASQWRVEGVACFLPPLVENTEEESGLKTGQMTKCWRIWGSRPNSRRASGQPLGGASWHWCSSQPHSSHAGQTCEDPTVPCPGGPQCVPELCASPEPKGCGTE